MTAPSSDEWSVSVDASGAANGRWAVHAKAKRYELMRVYALDPAPPQAPRRLLVNDTLRTPPSLLGRPDELPVGVFVRHRATVADDASDVDAALVPGAFSPSQCSTGDNPGDQCGSSCADPAVFMQNNARPDVRRPHGLLSQNEA